MTFGTHGLCAPVCCWCGACFGCSWLHKATKQHHICTNHISINLGPGPESKLLNPTLQSMAQSGGSEDSYRLASANNGSQNGDILVSAPTLMPPPTANGNNGLQNSNSNNSSGGGGGGGGATGQSRTNLSNISPLLASPRNTQRMRVRGMAHAACPWHARLERGWLEQALACRGLWAGQDETG